MLLSFPVLMLAQKIDWTVEQHVFLARVAFLIIQLACFLVGKYLKTVSGCKPFRANLAGFRDSAAAAGHGLC